MENKTPFTVNEIARDQPDKTIKGMLLRGPHESSVPESWIEFAGKIFVIFYTPDVVENSNLFAFDSKGTFLWRAPGTKGRELADDYVAFTWSEADQRLGATLWGGGGVVLDENTGEILRRYAGK